MKKFNTVKLGSSGTDVYILQSLLRALQYVGTDGKPLDVDGKAGVNTIHAINAFQERQRAYGYECGTAGDNDGKCGPKMWDRLLGVG